MTTLEETAGKIRAIIDPELDALTAIRHDIHAHPELGYQETRTSKLIVDELTRLGIQHKAGLAGGTGVVAHLPATTKEQGPAVGLRADMDALPITETTGKPYSSTNPGVMHACGHDGHTTILLGTARALAAMEHRPNPVTLIFQPAEEGGAGAAKMCADGVLEGEAGGCLGTPVGRIFALHGWPEVPLGTLATKPGPLLAATDAIKIVIRGSQAHAAFPHFGHDPIVAASHVVTALQTVASRNVAPTDSVVVTIGVFRGGTAKNVIPGEVELEGTIRTLRPETRELARERVTQICEQTASALGCEAEVIIDPGYPVTSNEPEATARWFEIATEAVGEDHVETIPEPFMGGEDFAFYGERVPSCFFVVGLRPVDQASMAGLHRPEFDFNDDAIGLGVEMMCRLALGGLGR